MSVTATPQSCWNTGTVLTSSGWRLGRLSIAFRICLSMGEVIRVFRCLVWVIAKLTHVWDVQIELTGSMVGYSSEVDEFLNPRAIRFASWMIPLTASIAPEVSLVSK